MKIVLLATDILGLSAAFFWGLVLIITAVAELATMNLVSIWFSAAALITMVAAFFGASVALQFIIFVLLSVLGFLIFAFLIRPKLARHSITATNADRIVGKEGIVVETICSTTGTGLIKVRGQTWSARLEEEGRLEEGMPIRVKEIKGVKAIVEAIDEERR